MKPSIIVFIPARFGSTRFPGKPLAKIDDQPMIMKVYKKARSAVKNVYVATDDQRIADAVTQGGGQAILTATSHESGTERVAEAVSLIDLNISPDTTIVNIQGDEPFIPSELISELGSFMKTNKADIGTCVHRISNQEIMNNPNRVKVVMNSEKKALYFSRSPIPYQADKKDNTSMAFQHIGIYAYRFDILKRLVKLEKSDLELSESLEQLRWLENGFQIHCLETNYHGFGIDTPEDLEKATRLHLS